MCRAKRRKSKYCIGTQFSGDATGTDQDDRSKLRIVMHAQYEFGPRVA